MSALTAAINTMRREPGKASFLAGVDILYGGSLACFNTSGYVMAASATAGYRLAGVVDKTVDNSGGSAGDELVSMWTRGEFLFKMASATQADVGKSVYVSDDQTVTLTAGVGAVFAGEIRSVPSSATVWVDIEPATQRYEGHLVTLKGALVAGTTTTGGDVLALANPFGATVVITDMFLYCTTPATGTPTLDVGVAADGTTSSDTLFDAVAVGAAAGVWNNIDNKGSNGGRGRTWSSTQYVTATPSATAAGLVGSYFIHCLQTTSR